jgi:L-lactate utilization protein LutC
MWVELADQDILKRTGESLAERGFHVEFLNNKEEAMERLKNLISPGAEVMTGSSTTLKEIGFIDFLSSGNHQWNNLKEKIVSEKDPKKQVELRKKSVISEYFLGSVHAITQSGQVVIASATGSQLSSYVYASNNVIWVVGTQKIVPNLEEGLRRIREYVFPLEDQRMKQAGYKGSTIAKILIFEKETLPFRKITLIFVKEKLGF